MRKTSFERTTVRLIDEFCSDLLDEGISPITIRNYRCDLEALAKWFEARGKQSFLNHGILGTEISHYKEELSKKFKTHTVNRKLASIRRWVRWRGDSGDILLKAKSVPSENHPESPSKYRCLSQNEERRLLQSARKNGNQFHLAALLMMLRMGLRASELCSLSWGNVDLVNRTIVLGLKADDLRKLPLDSACCTALTTIGCSHASEGEALVFSQSERPLTRRVLERMLEKLSRDAKIPDLTLHVLRFTFATRLAQTGANPFQLATFLGHKRLDVMKHYFMHPNEPGRATFADGTRNGYLVRKTVQSKRVKIDFSE